MTTVEILKEMAFTATETQRRALEDAISVLSTEGDLISRQAVLDLLKEHRALYCDNTPETFSKLSYAEKSRVDELDTAIATIINLPSVENKEEWIPVSERLPEKNVKDYLACCEDGYVATIMYDNGSWLINGNNVIAWMPLPEPYKKEGE